MTTSRGVRFARHAPWIAAVAVVNGLVLYNALFHDPLIGYDAPGHLKYIRTLAGLRLPGPSDTLEFFSPPLPYLPAAVAYRTGLVSLWAAAKAGQIVQFVCSVLLTMGLVGLCERVRPGSNALKVTGVVLLGMLPVYYRSFSFVRGEPMLALLTVVVAMKSLDVLRGGPLHRRDAILLGFALGLLVLTRQWGFFLIPAILLFTALQIRCGRLTWRRAVLSLGAIGMIAAVTGGWFYAHLRLNHGSIAAFNRTGAGPLSIVWRPPEFYVGLGSDRVFSDPVRRAFRGQLLPVFYSDFWGDYWGYFVIYGKDLRDGRYVSWRTLHEALEEVPPPDWLETNRRIGGYLGRVNLLSILPSAILVGGLLIGGLHLARLARGRADDEASAPLAFLFLAVATSVLGYLWFVLKFPGDDVIKATYLLHVYPLLGVLGAEFLGFVRSRSAAVHHAIVAMLVLVLLHNAPVYVTRYTDRMTPEALEASFPYFDAS